MRAVIDYCPRYLCVIFVDISFWFVQVILLKRVRSIGFADRVVFCSATLTLVYVLSPSGPLSRLIGQLYARVASRVIRLGLI